MLSGRSYYLTDIQILTIALAVILPLVALIYSNTRVSDITKRLDQMEKDLKEHIDNAFDHMKLLLELHEAKHHKN